MYIFSGVQSTYCALYNKLLTLCLAHIRNLLFVKCISELKNEKERMNETFNLWIRYFSFSCLEWHWQSFRTIAAHPCGLWGIVQKI